MGKRKTCTGIKEKMIFNKVRQLKADGKKIGITFSTFDMLHAGHVAMLAEAKNHCDYLICGLQTDPTIDRPDSKNKPIQSVFERYVQLKALKCVDEIIPYDTEADLYTLLTTHDIDVRIIGEDYINKDFTGKDLDIPIHYNSRKHSLSTSELRARIERASQVKK